MRAFQLAPALALLLLSGALYSQDITADAYPQQRVRMIKGDGHFPDPYYVTNRVVLRTVKLVATATGLQLSGDLFTDFDADRIPGDDQSLTRGQQKVNVELELVHYATQLKRRNNVVVDPKINPTKQDNPGVLVPGQTLSVSVTGRLGNFGNAPFVMPAMDKPLAPGIYVLVARVTFASQAPSVQKALRWCGDWFGAEYAGRDPDTGEDLFKPVMGDKKLHDQYYDEIMYTVRKAESYCMIHIGEISNAGRVELVAAGDRKTANYMMWTPHHEMAFDVQEWAYQLDNADKIVDEDLQRKLALEGASSEMKERWTKEAEVEKARIKRDNKVLIETWGGRVSKPESDMVRNALAAQQALLEQICQFEEYLTHRYWVLTDGHLYAGYHTVNAPGANCWQAVVDSDMRKYKDERLEKMEAFRKDKAAYDALWAKRTEGWKFFPTEVRTLVFAYLRVKEEKDTFDPDKYCAKEGGAIVLEVSKWREYRMAFIEKFLEQTNKIFDEVTTTTRFVNQVWPDALLKAQSARDSVISVAYSWEYHIRTQKMGHDAATVVNNWKEEANQVPLLKLDRYFAKAQGAPGTVKTTYDSYIRDVKSSTNQVEFAVVYRKAIEANTAEKDMPGGKKPK
ncbi:MAG: hypothetical protein IT464_00255 [Planctomycetes bacterium]|nr:hypothetical protein [Planctomycetota bacterium]